MNRLFNDNFSTAFSIGGWHVQWYAIFFLLGFFIAIVVACYRVRFFYKIKYDFIYYFTLVLIPASLLGARFWSACIGDLQWNNFFTFGTGGLAIQGGVVAALIVGLIYFPFILKNPKYHVRVEEGDNVYIQKPSLWIVVDVTLPVVLLGQAIGRWGNFFNGELFGELVTTNPDSPNPLSWLKTIMPGIYNRMICQVSGFDLIQGALYQPLFLYESSINIIVFGVIYFVLPNIKKIRIGVIGSSYLLAYGIIRFVMEPLRYQDFNFLGTYILNGLLLALGVILILIAQFIAPKYRDYKVIYAMWIKYIRLAYIKVSKKICYEKVKNYYEVDPELKKFGFVNKPNFIREKDEYLYYGPNETDGVILI